MAPVPQPDEHDKGPDRSTDNDPVDQMEMPDLIINQDESSDSEGIDDDETLNPMGYQMLPQDIDNDDDNEEEDDEREQSQSDSAIGGRLSSDDVPPVELDSAMLQGGLHMAGGRVPSYMQVPDLPRPESQDLLWNQSNSKKDLSMDTEQADKIKQTMSNVLLPKMNIPEWARGVTDDQLKEKLLKLQNKKT